MYFRMHQHPPEKRGCCKVRFGGAACLQSDTLRYTTQVRQTQTRCIVHLGKVWEVAVREKGLLGVRVQATDGIVSDLVGGKPLDAIWVGAYGKNAVQCVAW